MIWPCHETFRQVSVHLSDALLTQQAILNLHAFASELSEAMSSYYLEFRLAPDRDQVDFSACITVAHGGRSVLREMDGAPLLSADNPAKRGARSFLNCWATPGSALHEQIPLVWLEYDQANEKLPGPPTPCINFCLDPSFLKRRAMDPEAFHPNTRCYQPFVDVALEHLFGQSIPGHIRRVLENCFDALPPGGRIDYLAVMLTRNPAALKANIFVPREQLADYLARINWPGEWSLLEQVLATYLNPSAPVRLDMTIDDGCVSPRLGIECFAGDSTADDPARRHLLDMLVQHGYCCPSKRDAVLRWSGASEVIFPSQSWLTRIRRFWHLKLVCHAGRLTESKVYLAFTPGLYSPLVRGLRDNSAGK